MKKTNHALIAALLAVCLTFGGIMPVFADPVEPTSEPTIEATVESTIEPTVESIPDPTIDPAVEEQLPTREVDSEPVYDQQMGAAYDQNTVIVAFKPNVANQTVIETLEESDTVADTAVTEISASNNTELNAQSDKLIVAEVTENASVRDAINDLSNDPNVDYVQPNYLYTTLADNQTTPKNALTDFLESLATTNDPLATNQNYLTNGDWVGAQKAWNLAQTNKRVTIAVIDAGAKINHPDLADNIIASYDAVYPGREVVDTHTDTGGKGHGTHVNGIAAAVTNNNTGVSSLSYNAALLPIKTSDDDNKIFTSYLAAGYQYLLSKPDGPSGTTVAQKYNVRVVNISLGGKMDSIDTLLTSAIDQAYDHGILTVCASGNSGSSGPYTNMPSDYPTCISVINLSLPTEKANSSNYGPDKDISAPGSGIYSTLQDDTYGSKSGTSMASPVVAAAAALCFSVKPEASASEVRYALEHTATDLGATGRDDTFGWGRLNAYEAVKSLGYFDLSFDGKQCFINTNYHLAGIDWKITDGTGRGIITQDGVITTVIPGTVTVTATSQADPSITASAQYALWSPPKETSAVVLDGVDRFDTAAKIALEAYPLPQGSNGVIIANGTGNDQNNGKYADALAASTLAGLLDYPILLVEQNKIPQAISDALTQLSPGEIIVLGGTAVVSETLETQLAKYAPTVKRIYGNSRFETSVEIYKLAKYKNPAKISRTAIFAYAWNFPDSLAISPYAASAGAPIFLVDGDSLSNIVKSVFTKTNFDNAIILGGDGVVTNSIEQQINQILGKPALRLGGADRYQTAYLVAKHLVGNAALGYDGVGVASGQNFPDALTGGPLLAKRGAVILLADSNAAGSENLAALSLLNDDDAGIRPGAVHEVSKVHVFGGLLSVSQTVRTALENRLGWASGSIK